MDYNIIFLIVGVVIAVAGIVGTNIWSNKQRNDRLAERKDVQNMEVAKAARDKQKDEQSLAKEKTKEEESMADALSGQNKALALEVKQNMKDHVDRLIVTLKSAIELSRVQAYNKMESIEAKTAQNKIDLMNHIEHTKEEHLRMEKSIEFLQTLQFGPDAKSIPAYMTGEEETQEHKDRPDEGMFASRADTTHKDTKDPE